MLDTNLAIKYCSLRSSPSRLAETGRIGKLHAHVWCLSVLTGRPECFAQFKVHIVLYYLVATCSVCILCLAHQGFNKEFYLFISWMMRPSEIAAMELCCMIPYCVYANMNVLSYSWSFNLLQEAK